VLDLSKLENAGNKKSACWNPAVKV